jgi:hypothetical protein
VLTQQDFIDGFDPIIFHLLFTTRVSSPARRGSQRALANDTHTPRIVCRRGSGSALGRGAVIDNETIATTESKVRSRVR